MNGTATENARKLAGKMVRRSREVGAAMVLEIVSVISMAIIFPLTARNLGPERYGEYTTLYVLAGLGIVWVLSGAGSAVVQLIMQLGRSSDSLVHHGRRQIAVTGVVAALVGVSVAVAMLGGNVLVPALIVFGSELVLIGFSHVNVSVIFAIEGIKAATKINIVKPIVRTIGVVLLALAGAISLFSLVLVNLAAAVAALVLSTVAVRKHLGTGEHAPPTSRGELARYSTYYSTSMSTNAVQEEGDKVVMAASRPAVELGEYMAAYRVIATALIPFRAVSTAAVRWFLPKDARAGGQVTRTMWMSIPTVVYGVVSAGGILLLGDVVQWMVGDEFEEAVRITAWLCLVPLVHGLSELPFLGLIGLGRNRERMFLGFATGAVAVVLYLVLIPTLGWTGAVIGTYLSELLALSAGWVMLVRYQGRADDGHEPQSAPARTAGSA
jgi:O-antigen/teichoic acid export membrane protein